MRATYLQHQHKSFLPPVGVTIVAGEHDVGIRITDEGQIIYRMGYMMLIITRRRIARRTTKCGEAF